MQQLPPPHYRTLEYLTRHLARVAENSASTGMTAKNVAIVWAPNLLRCKELEFGGVAALQVTINTTPPPSDVSGFFSFFFFSCRLFCLDLFRFIVLSFAVVPFCLIGSKILVKLIMMSSICCVYFRLDHVELF